MRIDRDAAASGKVGEVDSVAATVEAQLDSVVTETLALQPAAYTHLNQQVGGALFEQARAHTILTILPAAGFHHDGFNTLQVQQMREHQSGGSGSDNSDLRAHERRITCDERILQVAAGGGWHRRRGCSIMNGSKRARDERSAEGERPMVPKAPASIAGPMVRPYRRPDPRSQVSSLYPPYVGTLLRAPRKPLIALPHTLSEVTGPLFGHEKMGETDNDLTRQHAGAPQGERITVTGRVLDDGGRPVTNTLIEIWQTNAAGRYAHQVDQHPAPLDPNFTGCGRTLTDAGGQLPVCDHQARIVSLEQSPERVAAGAYSFFAVRYGVRDTDGHADVLPGRSAFSVRSHLPFHFR